MAEIESFSVRYGGTVNLGNYENAKLEAEICGFASPGQTNAECLAELWEMVKESVRSQARELIARGKAAGQNGGNPPEAEASEEANSALAPFDARPQTIGQIITPKQLWAIRNLAREAGIDPQTECMRLWDAQLEAISKRAGSKLIDHLKARLMEQADAIRETQEAGGITP